MINEPLTATQGIIQTAIGNLSKQPSNNRLVYNSGQAFNPVTVMLWTIPIISFYEGIFYYITFTTVSYPWSVLGLEGMMIMMILLGGLFTCFFFHRQAMRIQFPGPVQSFFGNRFGPQSWEAKEGFLTYLPRDGDGGFPPRNVRNKVYLPMGIRKRIYRK